MAQTSELLTRIVADNNQFKSKLKESTNAAKQFHNETLSIFKEIGKGLVGALSIGAIIETLKGTSEGIDQMAASAKKLQISTQSFQSLEYAAKRSDVEIGTLEAGIKKLRLSASQALAGNSGLAGAFAQVGVSVKDLNGPVDKLYQKISEGLKGKSGNDQVGIVSKLFGGRMGQEQLNLLLNDMKQLNNEFNDLGGALSDLDIAKFDEMDKATDKVAQKMKRSLQGAVIALTPMISGLADAFVTMTERAGAGFSAISSGISEGASVLSGNNNYQSGKMKPSDYFDKNGTYINYKRRADSTSQVPNYKEGAITQSLDGLATAAAAASASLRQLGTGELKDLLGINDVTGKGYLSSILKQKPQAMNNTFTDLANQLRDIVAEGGNTSGVPFQSGLKLMESLARDAGLNKDTTNSGMLAAVRDLTNASKMMQNKQEVTVVVKVKDNEFISAVVDSKKFVNSVTDVAVIAAENSARGAAR